ncbi:nucleotidyltransferase family protein [Caldisalinibacter kiritimatiensis]|uniref:MobA-like NTP transferase domain-containing protein n=1 Tax=Caldisalinibacter kiritimatiensis TaxID=1304284 RepID=R1CYN0_9FIRM|nr:nucleotidyltransferase family protein [Caldisalinibacter kiritimatiensis]EOD01689.1 hypothetical protein L21TH_0230 [Caldisalinibacter kiritimatiensis]
MINTIVLAGRSNIKLQNKMNKALVNIKGKPMISYVIDALKHSKVVDQIVVVGEPKDFENIDLKYVDKIIKCRDSILDNIIVGLNYFKSDNKVMITTSDIPLLTGEAVKDFVDRSLETDADLYYPIINKNICVQKYPDAKRTYARLKEGLFTGGNMFIVNPSIVDSTIDVAKKMIEYRKNPLKMSRVLGFKFLLKFSTGKVSIKTAEQRVSELLGIQPKAIISDYAEIGNDVDKPEDIEMTEKYIWLER